MPQGNCHNRINVISAKHILQAKGSIAIGISGKGETTDPRVRPPYIPKYLLAVVQAQL
jgi:hypothetical protein